MNEYASGAWHKVRRLLCCVNSELLKGAFDTAWRARGEADKAAADDVDSDNETIVTVMIAITALDDPFQE